MGTNLPTYKIRVNPDDASGVFAVSLVDEPAIEVDFIKLAKEIQMEFAANKDKQMLWGPMLIPDKLIFRRDDKGNEFNIMFDVETIQLIADKFNENKLGDEFNFQHSDKKVEAVMLQNWITGEVDKSQEFGFSLPAGTWFGGIKVKDEGFWLNEVKSEKVKGFSVEIKCDIELLHLNNNKEKQIIKFMEIKTQDGVSLYTTDELVLEAAVYTDAEMTTTATDGDYTLEDGRVISVLNGMVAEIATPEEEAQDVTEDMATADAETETTSTTTKLELVPEEVIAIVQPMFEAMANQMAELVNKISELEAKLNENATAETQMQSLAAELTEKLSSIAGVGSVVVKNDTAKVKKEEMLMSKISALRNIRG